MYKQNKEKIMLCMKSLDLDDKRNLFIEKSRIFGSEYKIIAKSTYFCNKKISEDLT
jgi:hypothetical protein